MSQGQIALPVTDAEVLSIRPCWLPSSHAHAARASLTVCTLHMHVLLRHPAWQGITQRMPHAHLAAQPRDVRLLGDVSGQKSGKCSPSSAAMAGAPLRVTLGQGHQLHAHGAVWHSRAHPVLHFRHEASGPRSPGSTALTRTPFGASSKARFFVRASWAALATLYAGFPPRGIWEPTDPMFTTEPYMHACPGLAATAEKVEQYSASGLEQPQIMPRLPCTCSPQLMELLI